ncbi:MAG: glycoside hydrolase family 48 protein [Terracidiphilus sp.]
MSKQLTSAYGRSRVRRLSEYFTVLAALLLTFVAPHTYAQNACNVLYAISPQNSGAFGAAITIQNTGTTAWTNWTLTWAFANGQTVSQLWNGVEAQSGANVTVKNEPYNGSVAAGGSLSGIGFNGTWNGVTNAAPTSFAVNGTTCGGAATGSYTLKPSASSLSIAQGASGTDTITVTDVSPFAGSVSFAASGLPTGVTASFSPTSSASSSVVTFAVAATTIAGTYPITITGTSGTLTPVTTTISLTVPPASGFTLTPSASALSIIQGASGTDTITVKDTGTFTGSVTLAASGMPTGVTATFGTNPTTTTSVLTFAVASTTVAGTYPITIAGTSGTLTASTSISLTVTGPGSFSLSASPTSLTVAPGASGTDTITVTDVSPFAGSVTFAASGLPTGVTATFSPASSTTSSVVTFAVAATTAGGTYPITITGTSATLSATTSISLIVGTTSGACQVIYTISPQSSNAFGAALTIENTSATALTSWALTWTFANGQTVASLWNGIETQSGANVTVKNEPYNGSIAAGGSLTGIGFNGTWNGTTNAVPTNFAINGVACGGVGQGSFTLKPSASTLSVAAGASGTDTITVSDVSPFTGSVTFAASGMPPGVTATFSPASSTTSSLVTFAVAASTVAGTYPITITGTSGTLTATTSISLTVTTSGFSLAVSPPISVPDCGSASGTITVTDTGGFAGSITLAASGLPSGLTVGFGTNPVTSGSDTITFTAACTVTPGTYPITLTGTSGSTTSTTTFSITVTGTPGFTLSASPSTVTVAPGSMGFSAVTVTDLNGFTGSVNLAVSGLPTGVTVAIGTNPTTATSLLTFTVAATAADATSTITITGTSGTLTPVTTHITLTVGTGLTTFQQHFVDLYNDIHSSSNGYFGTATSGDKIPYHSVETLMGEAPDYGHETSSETYSYWIWLETLNGGLTGNWTGLQTAWTSMEDNMIPSATLQPTNSGYNASAPATYAPEHPFPSAYPSVLTSSVSVGTDPLASQLSATYGNANMYAMHWIIDTDNFYGFGQQEDGVTKPSCMNTFQRGANESVWLTVPQPCWDALKYGSTTNGYLDLFTAPSPYTAQWKYTDAPDADARTVQVMYWAEQYANAQGGNSIVTGLLPKAAKLGDYLRYSMFDKYFKAIGCTGASASATSCPAGSGYSSAHYLLGWYFAWGGALPADGSWAWRIGDGTTHFGYQNPVAAYALSKDAGISSKLPAQSVTDWSTSLERQLELYRWAQSDEGAIAGGATNSWEGSYSPTPTGDATFYNMAYDWEPVYHNPPSNQWFGMQTWSMERLAEYYYITGDSKAAIVLNSWIPWVEKATIVNSNGTFTLPGSLCWDNSPGQSDTTNPWNDSTCGLVASSTANKPATNWNATTQDWTTVPLNPNLHVRVTGTATDIGLAGSLAKALSYYSAAVGKWGASGTPDATSEALAKSLLDGVWTNYRDSIGISVAETRGDYCTSTTSTSSDGSTTLNGGFGATVFVPSAWVPGTMPTGEDVTVSPQPTFLSLRPKYKNDPSYPLVQSGCAGTGAGPTFNYHRFWAQVDIASAYFVYAHLFPGN